MGESHVSGNQNYIKLINGSLSVNQTYYEYAIQVLLTTIYEYTYAL